MSAPVRKGRPTDIDWALDGEMKRRMLAEGCPACSARAREVRARPAHAEWRLHFACGAQVYGVLGGARVAKACRNGGCLDGLSAAVAEMERQARRELAS